MKQLTAPIRNWQKQKILWKRLVIISAVIGLMGCGERYTEQGHRLSLAIANDLEKRGLSPSKLEIYVGHGDQVRYTIYGINDRKVLAAYVEYVVAHGIEVTGGVPISITVYPKSHREYVNKIFSEKQPIIEIEVKA